MGLWVREKRGRKEREGERKKEEKKKIGDRERRGEREGEWEEREREHYISHYEINHLTSIIGSAKMVTVHHLQIFQVDFLEFGPISLFLNIIIAPWKLTGRASQGIR